MNTLDEKFYDGFEGEPEIIFSLVKSNGEKEEIGIWDGYFNVIMNKIKPQKEGWTSLAYYFQLYIGWYDESPWLISNIPEACEQLKEIDKESFENKEEKEILESIICMLEKAIFNNEKVYISYE